MKRLVKDGLFALTTAGILVAAPLAMAQEPGKNLVEPVYRLSKNDPINKAAPHALDPALDMARRSMQIIQSGINDYTAVIVKREMIDGVVGDYEYMYAKVRNRKVQNNQIEQPLSVYLTFLKPKATKGREALFVETENDGKMYAHEGGMKRMLGTHLLETTSFLAMRGQRYPITDIGIENLVLKLIERGERDKRCGDCQVEFLQGAKVDGRSCTVLQVTHPDKKPEYDFHIAQVFIDDELEIPVRYAAYLWPESPNAAPQVLEEYTYQKLKINVGLTDEDFDVNNPAYNFHKQ